MSCMAGMVGHGQRQREFPLHALRQLRQTLAGVQRKALQQGLIPAFVPVFKEPGGDGGNFAHPPAGIADGAPGGKYEGTGMTYTAFRKPTPEEMASYREIFRFS